MSELLRGVFIIIGGIAGLISLAETATSFVTSVKGDGLLWLIVAMVFPDREQKGARAMSGGSYNYFYSRVDDVCFLLSEDLRAMLATCFRAVEWAESCDTSKEDSALECFEAVKAFMDKHGHR